MRLDFKKNEKLIRIASIILIGILVLFMFKTPVTDKGTSKASGDSGNLYDATSYYEEKIKSILEASYGEATMKVMVSIEKTKSNSYISDNDEYKISGVLIVTSVSGDSAKADITYAISSLFDLPTHRVAVITAR